MNPKGNPKKKSQKAQIYAFKKTNKKPYNKITKRKQKEKKIPLGKEKNPKTNIQTKNPKKARRNKKLN